MKLDLLAIVAHPDDLELSGSGTFIKHAQLGYKTGIADMTQGELGTRGTVQTRAEEAAEAARILGLAVRDNLGMRDGFFEETEENLLKVIRVIRKYQPTIVFANAVEDRHPDHGRASHLVSRACFLAGLIKVETQDEQGNQQAAWRPKLVYHLIQDRYIKPDFVVDISAFMEQKMETIRAFKTQFYNPNSKEPQTPISSKEFIEHLQSRHASMGREIGASYGEGFTVERPVGVDDLFQLR